MTAKEIIEKLQTFPPETEIVYIVDLPHYLLTPTGRKVTELQISDVTHAKS